MINMKAAGFVTKEEAEEIKFITNVFDLISRIRINTTNE